MDMTKLRMQVRSELDRAGFTTPNREADLLMSAISGRSLGELELDHLLGRELAPELANRILRAARSRARREPLQYLAGTAPFYGLDFRVGAGVFVPRPETEQLVEFTLQFLSDHGVGSPAVADIGSGSGAIAAAVAVNHPDACVTAFEASPFAWPWLVDNLRRLAPTVTARFGDWREQIKVAPPSGGVPAPGERETAAGAYECIVSNPPYVPSGAIPADPEVRLFDPEMALYSGADGLNEIRRIANVAVGLLRPGGLLAVEHTEDQGAAVREIFSHAGLRGIATEPDLTARDRFTRGIRA